jgi:integrator complex subunit 6
MGSELTLEQFRWDQRFFSIIFNMQSIPAQDQNTQTFIPYASQSPVNIWCDATGGNLVNLKGFIENYTIFIKGRSYLISSQRMLMQCLESLVSKIQAGVVLNFERFGIESTISKGKLKQSIVFFHLIIYIHS